MGTIDGTKKIVIEGFASKVEQARKEIVEFLERAQEDYYKKIKLSDDDFKSLTNSVNSKNLGHLGDIFQLEIKRSLDLVELFGPPENIQFFEGKVEEAITKTKQAGTKI